VLFISLYGEKEATARKVIFRMDIVKDTVKTQGGADRI